ncbi:SCO family protein [Roseateles chitinivorans]|uniref:SCO family protein n=1 Tax=Roseateles chitinivorans TaxID=2917965 RepID=UPI003D666C33
MNDSASRPTTSLAPTLAVCAVVLAVAAGAIAHLTRGFELWTFEDLRRDEVSRSALRAVPTSLVTANGASLEVFDATAPAGSTSRPAAYVVDFIYTNCASVCQTLGAEFYRMQDALRREGRSDVRLLSVSIDPKRDTVPALRAYAALHRADGERWAIVAPIRMAALQDLTGALGVIAIPDGLGGFVHNGAIHVIDSSGVVLGIHDYDDWETALRQARGHWPSPLPLPQAGEGERPSGAYVARNGETASHVGTAGDVGTAADVGGLR